MPGPERARKATREEAGGEGPIIEDSYHQGSRWWPAGQEAVGGELQANLKEGSGWLLDDSRLEAGELRDKKGDEPGLQVDEESGAQGQRSTMPCTQAAIRPLTAGIA